MMENFAKSSQLPSWLAKYASVGFNADDMAALISSIDSSQNLQSSLAHLPAELILLVLEYVPIDYVLDWRLVCRGFRDAIDGRILYHHLHRTQLVGFVGPRTMPPMTWLSEDQYNQIQFLYANFQHVETNSGNAAGTEPESGPVWSDTYAVFKMEDAWFQAFPRAGNATGMQANTIQYAEEVWNHVLPRLELSRTEEGFGTLRWCIKLDHAVLDLDFPLEAGRTKFDIDIDLYKRTVKVAWKDMLFRFLKTEAVLRRTFYQKKREGSKFTYNLAEDCLRQVRRQRLHSALDPDNKVDRHLKWSLRLLPPLFARLQQNDMSPLQAIEATAINTLLLLRREAAMTSKQIAQLQQLNDDFSTMQREMTELDHEFSTFKSHMFPEQGFSYSFSMLPEETIPYNPVAWPDELRNTIQGRVSKWKAQKKVMKQIHTLLSTSNEALAVPEDSFDDLGSDI